MWGGRLEGEVYAKILPQPILLALMCFVSLLCLMKETVLLVFRYFLEEIIPYVALDLLCSQKEVSSEYSCFTILNQNPPLLIAVDL